MNQARQPERRSQGYTCNLTHLNQASEITAYLRREMGDTLSRHTLFGQIRLSQGLI